MCSCGMVLTYFGLLHSIFLRPIVLDAKCAPIIRYESVDYSVASIRWKRNSPFNGLSRVSSLILDYGSRAGLKIWD